MPPKVPIPTDFQKRVTFTEALEGIRQLPDSEAWEIIEQASRLHPWKLLRRSSPHLINLVDTTVLKSTMHEQHAYGLAY